MPDTFDEASSGSLLFLSDLQLELLQLHPDMSGHDLFMVSHYIIQDILRVTRSA